MIRNTSTGIGPWPMSDMTSESSPSEDNVRESCIEASAIESNKTDSQFFGRFKGIPIRREAFISLEADIFMNNTWSFSADKTESFFARSKLLPGQRRTLRQRMANERRL